MNFAICDKQIDQNLYAFFAQVFLRFSENFDTGSASQEGFKEVFDKDFHSKKENYREDVDKGLAA